MINFSRESIEIGGSGGGSGGGAPPPNGYNPEWLPAPATTDTTVNGKTDALYMLCNVLDTGNRNYFSCNASGNYTVNVYTGINGTLISTQDFSANVQANWQIDYAACTHQLDALTRQAYVEIVPQSGQVLSELKFNTNHPNETNTNTAPNVIAVIGALPALTNATNMFTACYSLQSVNLNLPALTNATNMFYICLSLQSVNLSLPALTNAAYMFNTCYSLQSVNLNLPALTNATNMFYTCNSLQSVNLSLPALTNATNMFYACYSLQSVNLNLPALTNATNMFGTAMTDGQSLRSLRKIQLTGLKQGFALNFGALQAPEINELFTSLGDASGAKTIDIRNQPGSATCNVSIAVVKGYTVVIA